MLVFLNSTMTFRQMMVGNTDHILSTLVLYFGMVFKRMVKSFGLPGKFTNEEHSVYAITLLIECGSILAK